jgi:hypothetical protein
VLLTEREVKRIVSIHFREKYEMEVNTDDMNWRQEHFPKGQAVWGLDVEGGVAIVRENGTNRETD